MREGWDDDPDRHINTLVWHKRPVVRLDSGSRGEKPQYGYQRLDNGRVMMTETRGWIDDSLGAPKRKPGEESEPMWLRPRAGAPDRIGIASSPTNQFFDESAPRCNCTKTHKRDLKNGEGEMDYRRDCEIHGAAAIEKKTAPPPDDDEDCNCNATSQWDVQCGRVGWDCRRRCKIHGPYHTRVNDDEDDSKWKRALNKCLSVFDRDDDPVDNPPTRAETFLGHMTPARPKSFFDYEKQGLRAMSEPKAARPNSFMQYNQAMRINELRRMGTMQSVVQVPPMSPAMAPPPPIPMSPATPTVGVSRSKSVATRPSHKASVKRRPRTNTVSTVSTMSTTSDMSRMSLSSEDSWDYDEKPHYREKKHHHHEEYVEDEKEWM